MAGCAVDFLHNNVPLVLTVDRPFHQPSCFFPGFFYIFYRIHQSMAQLFGTPSVPTSRTSSATYHWKYLVFSADRGMVYTD